MAVIHKQKDIDHFFQFFQARLEFVKTNCLERIEGMILICSYLDSLAGYRYGGRSNAGRFKLFLTKDTDQADTWLKVSLILLRQYLEHKDLALYSKLITLLDRLGATTSSYVNLNHSPDISLESLMDRCQKEISEKEMHLFRDDLKRFQYSTILWDAYRSPSVHETRVRLKRAMNLHNIAIPFHSNLGEIRDMKIVSTRTCFDIPPEFMIATLESGLENLRQNVLSGKCTLCLSDPYDEPLHGRRQQTPVREEATVGYPRIITKPFRSFLNDIGYLLDQAKISHDLFLSTDDGVHRWREGAMARSAITTSVFFLESIVNSLIIDFKLREPDQLPDSLHRKATLTHQTIDRLPLIERVFLAPYLCASDENRILSGFFNRDNREFRLLEELIEIRHSFAHSRPIHRKLTLTQTGEKEWIADDKYKENFWPCTLLPRDIFSLGWGHAVRAKEIVDWAAQRLDIFLEGRIGKGDWMTSERIELEPPIPPVGDVSN